MATGSSIDADIDTCIERDPKGLYKKALAGEIRGFTGIDSAYESPVNPDIHMNTAEESVEDCIDTAINAIKHL